MFQCWCRLGSTRSYIDKNYGGVLIVWDRIFGTFEAEHKDEPIVYGLTSQLKFFNPLYLQVISLVWLSNAVGYLVAETSELMIIVDESMLWANWNRAIVFGRALHAFKFWLTGDVLDCQRRRIHISKDEANSILWLISLWRVVSCFIRLPTQDSSHCFRTSSNGFITRQCRLETGVYHKWWLSGRFHQTLFWW